MIDYMGPSLDTTIFGIGNGVWLFAKHPGEWQKVRESPARVPTADGSPMQLLLPPAEARLRDG
jgi:cytochrome P450